MNVVKCGKLPLRNSTLSKNKCKQAMMHHVGYVCMCMSTSRPAPWGYEMANRSEGQTHEKVMGSHCHGSFIIFTSVLSH